jgi:DNA-binding PadR family transcriptional regulator
VADRRSSFSPQTSRVLIALGEQPAEWRYGYELGLEVGLKSGSLYPILMRLSDMGLLESKWEHDPPAGRPPRHLYRLDTDGIKAAAELRGTTDRRTSTARRPQTNVGFGSVPC